MRRLYPSRLLAAAFTLGCCCWPAVAKPAQHGRGYKPPPATATVVVTVEKAANSKPMPNAAVVFRAMRNGEDDGNLEMKTDPDGRASIDLLAVGSHVTVQVIADGFSTYATEFDLTNDGKQVLVKLQRPRAQVSTYTDDQNAPSQVQPGVQEKQHSAPAPNGTPTAAPPSAASPTAPLQTTPPANTPATLPGSNPAPGSPQ